MVEAIVEFFSSLTQNDYLTLFLVSVVPVIELRGAIIIMGGMENINYIVGALCCVAGSTSVILPLLFLVRPLINKLKNSKKFKYLGEKLERILIRRSKSIKNSDKPKKRSEAVHSDLNNSVYGKGNYVDFNDSVPDTKNTAVCEKELAAEKIKKRADFKRIAGLYALVAVPLPLTGAWTGSCVGALLNIKLWQAALAIFAGNITSACIMTLLIVFIDKEYIDYVLYAFCIFIAAILIFRFFLNLKFTTSRQRRD